MPKSSIIYRFLVELMDMRSFGASKHFDKMNNHGKPNLYRIYSFSTFTTYKSAVMRFANYCRDNFGCRTPEEARPYVADYLRLRIGKGLSAWTIHVDASALAKVYHCSYVDFGVALPQRLRRTVRRNRSLFWELEQKYPELVRTWRSIGLRRHELLLLVISDVIQAEDGTVWIHVRKGKGGLERFVHALDDSILAIVEEAKTAGRDKLFPSVPSDAPVHAYRRAYAQTLYEIVARDVSGLSRQEQYRCRAELQGTVLDRRAMDVVSRNLGHNRLGVVVTYLCPACES